MSPMLWQLTWGAGVLDPSDVSRGAVQQGTQLIGGLHAGGPPSGIHPCVGRLHHSGTHGLNMIYTTGYRAAAVRVKQSWTCTGWGE